MEGFFDFFWLMLWFFLWIIWIWLLIRVFGDIFRADMSGWAKAGWMVFILILPFLGVFIYLITQGDAMGRREMERIQAVEQAQRAYIRDAAGTAGGIRRSVYARPFTSAVSSNSPDRGAVSLDQTSSATSTTRENPAVSGLFLVSGVVRDY